MKDELIKAQRELIEVLETMIKNVHPKHGEAKKLRTKIAQLEAEDKDIEDVTQSKPK